MSKSSPKFTTGFTLIELLTVIAIIALLASIIIASLSTARQRSRDSKRVSDVKNIELSLSLYYNDHSAYPATIGALVPNYLSVLPTDPNYSVTSATCASSPTTAGCYWYAGLVASGGSAGGTCLAYHLGTSLEQTTNTALNNDADYVPSGQSGGTADSAICSGAQYSGTGSSDADFYGVDTNACDNSSAGACYDTHS